MEKIKSFQITGMTLSGFKCYTERTTLSFGSPTVITGGNGRGKSSLADAIAFAVTGLPFFGERGIDRLHSETNPELCIAMRFTDECGTAHELIRTRQKERMSITYDGISIRQADLNEMFGERDVFLSIFNPLYFIEELGEDGKKLLERYLPPVSQEEILSQLNEQARDRLSDLSIPSPEGFLKRQREEIRELEQNAIYLSGKRDLAEKQKAENRDTFHCLTVREEELQQAIAALEPQRFAGLDLADLQEQLVQASERYDELSREAPEMAETQELDAQLQKLHLRHGAREAEVYSPKYTQPLAQTSARVQALAKQYQKCSTLLDRFQPGMACPTCRRVLSDTEYPAFRQAVQAEQATICTAGAEQKRQLAELQELEQKANAVFEQFRAEDLAACQSEIENLQQQREQRLLAAKQQNEQRQQELEQLRSSIRSLSATIECGTLSPADSDCLAAYKQELEDCRVQLAAAKQRMDAPPEDFAARIAQAEQQIKEKKALMKDVILYMSKRAELLFSSLAMNRVQISLYDVVKSTGEVKDVFRFTYNGRRYDRLSLSEKVRAGMEVSELIKRLTGRNYPVFADNMESVDDLSNVRPTGQMILAKCVRNAELSVRAGNPTISKAA